MPSFHPAALLRDPQKKRFSWQDLQSIRRKLDEG
jgi:uracil-DNA glycosylase